MDKLPEKNNSHQASLEKKTEDKQQDIFYWSEGSIAVGRVGETNVSSFKKIKTDAVTVGADKFTKNNGIRGLAFRFGKNDIDVGSAGSNGNQGFQGFQGRQGNQGPSGPVDITYSDTKPSSPDAGDMWFDSDNGVFYIYLNDGDGGSQWVEIIGDKGDSINFATSTTGLNADILFGSGFTAYKNSFITLNTENIPFITKFAEKIYDQGTADSNGGQTFTLNLNDASIHYADMTTGTTSGTYSFTFTGNSELTASSTSVLILRGGQNLTFNWVNMSWEDSAGAPDFTSATAGVYSLIPFSYLTINSIGWIGGSMSVYKP